MPQYPTVGRREQHPHTGNVGTRRQKTEVLLEYRKRAGRPGESCLHHRHGAAISHHGPCHNGLIRSNNNGFTDGGCRDQGFAPVSWCGIYFGTKDHRNRVHALKGSYHPAQRSGNNGNLRDAGRKGHLQIRTDNCYVYNTRESMKKGNTPCLGAENINLWRVIYDNIAGVAEVGWVKAHLTCEQAIAKGFRATYWARHNVSYVLATRGINRHQADIINSGRSRQGVRSPSSAHQGLYLRYQT